MAYFSSRFVIDKSLSSVQHAHVVDKKHIAILLIQWQAMFSASLQQHLNGTALRIRDLRAPFGARKIGRSGEKGCGEIDLHFAFDIAYDGPIDDLHSLSMKRYLTIVKPPKALTMLASRNASSLLVRREHLARSRPDRYTLLRSSPSADDRHFQEARA